jgi:ABC-type proline/glycine betaine transport system ATPase subunit
MLTMNLQDCAQEVQQPVGGLVAVKQFLVAAAIMLTSHELHLKKSMVAAGPESLISSPRQEFVEHLFGGGRRTERRHGEVAFELGP